MFSSPTPTEWGLFSPIFPHVPKSHLSHRKGYKTHRKSAKFRFKFGYFQGISFGIFSGCENIYFAFRQDFVPWKKALILWGLWVFQPIKSRLSHQTKTSPNGLVFCFGAVLFAYAISIFFESDIATQWYSAKVELNANRISLLPKAEISHFDSSKYITPSQTEYHLKTILFLYITFLRWVQCQKAF